MEGNPGGYASEIGIREQEDNADSSNASQPQDQFEIGPGAEQITPEVGKVCFGG